MTDVTIHLCGQVLQPGDRLILTTERPLSAEQAQQIKAQLKDRLPDVEVVVALGLNVTIARAS